MDSPLEPSLRLAKLPVPKSFLRSNICPSREGRFPTSGQPSLELEVSSQPLSSMEQLIETLSKAVYSNYNDKKKYSDIGQGTVLSALHLI